MSWPSTIEVRKWLVPRARVGCFAKNDLPPRLRFVRKFAFSLLRVRCALALARLQVRHQSELDHLLPYKLHHLSLQNGVDDLETQLETERQLRHADAAELERCHAQIAQLQQEQETLQTVMARCEPPWGSGWCPC